ncbi:hypothetical protein C8R47DRAFT_1227585 [Mycena vitilis]|nr:hypothetical protein C8R47DRAFT_1227585 [Mycena vitilis]
MPTQLKQYKLCSCWELEVLIQSPKSSTLPTKESLVSATQLILVIGATGAQGMAAIDGSSKAATACPLQLAVKGVECVQGTFENVVAEAKAMDGVYGAYINTDTFTVGEMRKIYAGLNIRGCKHGAVPPALSLERATVYAQDLRPIRPSFQAEHLNAKGQVTQFVKALLDATRSTGTRSRSRAPAVHLRLAPEEWWPYFIDAEVTPMASTATRGDGSTTAKENYTRWWALYRDNMIGRDMHCIKSIHPGTQSTETWMRRHDTWGFRRRAAEGKLRHHSRLGEDETAVEN